MRSLQLQLSEPVYAEVQRAADAAGFPNLETYVVDLIAQETENFDPLFTPERLAEAKAAWKMANPS